MQIAVVHPDLSLEIPLALYHSLRAHHKNICAQLIDFLAAHILDVVLVQVVGGQHKGLYTAQVPLVLRADADGTQSGERSVCYFLKPLSVLGKHDVFLDVEGPPDLAIRGKLLHLYNLAVSIVFAGSLEFLFLRRKTPDDVLYIETISLRRSAAGRIRCSKAVCRGRLLLLCDRPKNHDRRSYNRQPATEQQFCNSAPQET